MYAVDGVCVCVCAACRYVIRKCACVFCVLATEQELCDAYWLVCLLAHSFDYLFVICLYAFIEYKLVAHHRHITHAHTDTAACILAHITCNVFAIRINGPNYIHLCVCECVCAYLYVTCGPHRTLLQCEHGSFVCLSVQNETNSKPKRND